MVNPPGPLILSGSSLVPVLLLLCCFPWELDDVEVLDALGGVTPLPTPLL